MQSPQKMIEDWKIYSIFWKVYAKCIAQVSIPWKLQYVLDWSKDTCNGSRCWKIQLIYPTFAKCHLKDCQCQSQGGTWGEICKISRCKSIVVLSPFHWYFSREKTSVWKHKDCHKHHWCCWGCWKHKAKLLTTAEKRERGRERSTINSQITHVKTHNWPCWSNDSEPRYQDIKLKYFLCEKGYTVEHALETIKSIVEYFNKRYGNKMPEMSKAAVNSHVDEGIVHCLMWVKFVNAMFDLIQQK